MKRFGSILIAVVLMFSAGAFAKYSGGDGSPSSPYLIGSPGDLIALAANTGDYTSHFRQTANINLLGTTRTTALIAPDTDNATEGFQGTAFMGTYDGNGYQIQNFQIDTAGGNQDFLGLFGTIGNNSLVKNVRLINCGITGGASSDYCGGICGQNSFSLFDCEVSGTVSGRNRIGGISGYNTATLSGCFSSANVSGYDHVGGLCGYSGGTITECSAIGSATGHDNVGSLCGYLHSGTVTRCDASGVTSGDTHVGGLVGQPYSATVSESYATGSVQGITHVGGLAGYINSSTVSDCYALGSVAGTGENTGGFAGYVYSGSVYRCYARGEVTGGTNVGGCLGRAYSATVTDSYSTGPVAGSVSIGGFCGNKNATFSGCLWDTDTSLLTTSAGGEGKTTAQMQAIDTFLEAGWRISADVLWYYWYLPINDYPILAWEPAVKVPAVTGLTQAEAETTINLQGFTAGQIIYKYDAALDPEIVVGQYPAAGLNRKPGRPIHLVVRTNTPRHYSGGAGTASNPYLIGGINDLMTLGNNPSDYHKSFRLITDIDMADWCLNTAVISPDTSLADNYQGTAFTGKFDGNGHRLLNLTIYPEQSGREYTGLFGSIGTLAEIANVHIENGFVDNRWRTDYHSLLCAASSGTIRDCSVSGRLREGNYVGGLCASSSGSLSNCQSGADIQAYNYAGSLCGEGSGTITLCSSTGSVSGNYFVGGLCGSVPSGTVSRCDASGSVSGSNEVGGLIGEPSSATVIESYATGSVRGGTHVGGLAGYSNSSTVSDCYALGAVAGTGENAGGFAGYVYGGSVNRCYAQGEVTGGTNVGGCFGRAYSTTVYDSYSTGPVSGSASVGGFCGLKNATFYGCFWDVDTSLLTTSAGGEGKTTPEMLDIDTFLAAGWRISGDVLWYYWYIPINDYPRLSWEIIAAKVPDVVGLSQPEAMTAIAEAQFTVGRVLYQFNNALPIGTVVNQYPTAGLNRGIFEPVDIVVSTLSDPNYSGGDGSPEAPFQIHDPNDLLTMANNPHHWDRHFVLTADLDLEPWAFTTAVISPDTSTASGYQGAPFEGMFDGGQHVIRNLVLYPEKAGRGYLGLFGQIGGSGQVSDLGIDNFRLDNRWSADYSGGLCGVNYGLLQRCYTTGEMQCSSYAGGLCGATEGDLVDCYSTITLAGYDYVGGLCGEIRNSAIVSGCHAVAEVTGRNYVGGLAGAIASSASVSDSFVTGWASGNERVGGFTGNVNGSSIARCFAYVNIQADSSHSGGFAGRTESSTVSECCGYGDVEGVNYAGGFAGSTYYGAVYDCYATGWVLGNDHIGGFVGNQNNATVSRCYSIGSVVGGATAVNVGGFSGSGSCGSSFWDKDTSFKTISSCGTGLYTAQMLGTGTYAGAGWSISLDGVGTTWHGAVDSYPWLSWETDIYLIPGVVGKQQADAELEILDLGFCVGTVTPVYSEAIPAGQVISQYPPAGSIAVPGACINLVISSGLADVSVPYVIGMQASQAEAAILYAKLLVGTVTYQAHPTAPIGTVISQSPSGGTQVPQQSTVNLVISSGSGSSVVPNLAALTQAEAEAVIAAAGFVLGDVILQYSNVVAEGYVISHDPPAGTPVIPGAEIDLVVSDGPQPVVVPDLTGMDEFTAVVTVFSEGLSIGIMIDQYSSSVPAGIVISHLPAAGQTVEAGSSVDLVISLGPVPVSVPTVVGMSQSEAVDALIAAGLFVGQITLEYNDAVAAGLVYSQSPSQGSVVSGGTSVDLWISMGPHQITVPPVIGLSLETAVQTIENADLVAGSLVEQYSDTIPSGSVVSQSPDAGTVVSSGSAVDLVISKGPAPCTPPDWTAPYGPNVMVIYARIEVNGIEITAPGSMLGAFIGGDPAGYTEVEDRPTGTVYQLVVTSDGTSGPINFRVFDAAECKIYVIPETLEFVPGAVVGSLIEPIRLEASLMELRADIDHNGTVDLLDLAILASEWTLTAD